MEPTGPREARPDDRLRAMRGGPAAWCQPRISLRSIRATYTASGTRGEARPLLVHRLAAVDVEGLPGHEIAGGRGQEHHRPHEIGRKLHALEGAAGDTSGEIVPRGRLHLGVALGHAGGDGV